MQLRPVNVQDPHEVARIVDLAEAFHELSDFRNLPFSRQKVHGLIIALSSNHPRHAFAKVAEIDGEVVGGMFAMLMEPHYSECSVVQDYGVYVDMTKRSSRIGFALVEDMLKWATSSIAKEIWLGETAGIEAEAVQRLYEHFGFRKQGTLYRRII